MNISITTQSELEDHLYELGLRLDDDIIVHSSLFNFGVIEGGTSAVYQAFRNVIGNEATLAVPTYMLGTLPEQTFNPKNSPSKACGSFSEYVRELDGAVRSLCPLHNHSAIGPKASLLRDVDGSKSLGYGSDFDVLHQAGFSTLLLGCPFTDGATFIIHLEAVIEVPYREWVGLERNVVMPDGTMHRRICKYYQRKGAEFIEDLMPIKHLLKEKGHLHSVKLRQAESCHISNSGYSIVLEALQKNPYLTLTRQ